MKAKIQRRKEFARELALTKPGIPPKDFGSLESKRYYSLRKKFGITLDEYNRMLERQKGKCAICRKKCATGRSLAVDHDHETGKVRGLLCNSCNRGLGFYEKRSQEIQKYLQIHT